MTSRGDSTAVLHVDSCACSAASDNVTVARIHFGGCSAPLSFRLTYCGGYDKVKFRSYCGGEQGDLWRLASRGNDDIIFFEGGGAMEFDFLRILQLLLERGVIYSFRVTKDKIYITIKK